MMPKDYYNKCLEIMYGFRRFGIKLGLDTIREILAGLGNPQEGFRSIHIAGTNGKGSIASALSSILHAAGYKVGLYTSPHLLRFNERICVNNRPISDEAVVEAYEAVNNVPKGEREPTFFEFATAMGLYEFGRQGADWAIIETGMGGRLDATNVLQPEVVVISNVSVEHREYLGDTIGQIASEKGGIIKPGVPVVTGVGQEEAISVLRGIAAEKSAPLYRLGEDFRTIPDQKGLFTYSGIHQTWPEMQTGLAGNHQVDNAALVLATCELLNRQGANLSPKIIRRGLVQTRWPGRLEVVSDSPMVILDGAHNLAAAENLARFLGNEFKGREITLLIGILDDKPYAEMLGHLLPVCRKVILNRPKIDRALPAETLETVARTLIQDITVIPDVAESVRHALAITSPDGVICIAGSLYVVGEAKAFLEKTRGIPSFQKNASA